MVNLVPMPDWFLGKDILIDIFSLIVLITFFVLSMRGYKINENRKFLYLGIGFGLIALAGMGLIATKGVMYYNTSVTTSIGSTIIKTGVVNSTEVLYAMSFFFYRLFTLLGFYVIYRLPRQEKSVGGDFALVSLFIILSAFVSQEHSYIFHIATLLILVLIAGRYYKIYGKNGFLNTKILAIGFSILALSQLLFAFSDEMMVVLGSALGLVGYSIFLGLIIRILKSNSKAKI